MFKLAPKTQPFPYDVQIPVIGENGTPIKHRIRFLFKRLSRTQFDAMAQETRPDENTELSAPEVLDLNVRQAIGFCVGWQDVIGADDQPLEFNPDNLRLLFDAYPSASQALQSAYIQAWNGGAALQKN